MKKNRILLIAVFIISCGLFQSVHATPIEMRLTSGSDFVQIIDNGLGDLDPILGRLIYGDALGAFFINVTIGESVPFIGTETAPQLQLISVNISSLDNNPASLTIEFSGDGFGPLDAGLTGFQTDIWGGAGTSVSFKSYVDSIKFGTLTNIADLGFGPGAFSGSSSMNILPAPNPFSLTAVATINHSSGMNATNFSMTIKPMPIPEPSTLFLLGTGLLGIGFYTRRKK